MTSGRTLWTLLLLTIALSVPSVFCRLDYAQYYISKYHKVVSTTESISSPTPEVSEHYSSEERVSPSEDNQLTGPQGNETVIQHGDEYNGNFQTVFVTRIVIIVSSVIFVVIVLGCIVCCCPACRGKPRPGFIIRDNRQGLDAGTYQQQPFVPQPPPTQTAVLVQHFPPNYSQEPVQQPYVPPYPHPGQQQAPYSSPTQAPNQYSPNSLQFYNPPEAPPPYENAPPYKH